MEIVRADVQLCESKLFLRYLHLMNLYSLRDLSQTPGGERWFVNGVQLTFSTKESVFKHINHPSKYFYSFTQISSSHITFISLTDTEVRAQTPDGNLLFVTPVGRSFKCHREIEINLSDPSYPDLKVKLLLRELTVEPFIFKNNDFGPGTYQ